MPCNREGQGWGKCILLLYTIIILSFFPSNPISRKGYLEFCEQDTTWHKKYVVSDISIVYILSH